MADEAGPSGSGTGKVDAAVLAEADRKFEQGIQCIRVGGALGGARTAQGSWPEAPPRRRRLRAAPQLRFDCLLPGQP